MTEPHDDFDETLRRAAAEYNRPPGMVPRDDMWAAIQARRAPPIALVTDQAAPAAAARPVRRMGTVRQWWGLAAAASVLLATGIGIGRWSSGDVAGVAAPAGGSTTAAAVDGTAPTRVDVTTLAPVSGGAGTRPELAAAEPAAAAPVRREAARGAAPARDARIADVTYTLATLQHLTDAEALLVTYRTESADSAVDARLSSWARDLVADTRLLLDSPAAVDPRRRRLLEDLELVLVQLVQLDAVAPARQGAGSERELIDGSMRRGQLLTRLRSAIPAGTGTTRHITRSPTT